MRGARSRQKLKHQSVVAKREKHHAAQHQEKMTTLATLRRFASRESLPVFWERSRFIPQLFMNCIEIGHPRSIGVDQGSEFVSRDLDLWAYQDDVTLDFSRRPPTTRSLRHSTGAYALSA